MPGAHNLQITDVDHHLCRKMVITRRDIDHRSRLSPFIYIRIRLPVLDIRNDTVDHRSDILIWIARRPLCHIVIILTTHTLYPPIIWYNIAESTVHSTMLY